MKWLNFLWIALIAWGGTTATEAQVGNTNRGWSIAGTNPVTVQFGGKTVAVYNPGVEEAKPFFYPIIGPTGENMTRHYPQTEIKPGEEDDHIHHRGLWYGLGSVNGLDFWHFPGSKKDKKFGRIVHKAVKQLKVSGNSLSFGTESDWVDDETNNLVCQDARFFTFSHDDKGSLVLDTSITLIASKDDVQIKDDKEGAWSIRVPPTMRLEGKVAKGGMVNNEGLEGKDVWGKRSAWVQYFGPDAKGNEAGIAILDHPSNLRHPTWWHARHYGLFTANPFGQGNFEKETEKGAGDYTIKAGDSLTFRYRTIFHQGGKDAIDVKKAFEDFSAHSATLL